MKNKKLLYILIPGVIMIWGIIIYRIFEGSGGAENSVIQKIEVDELQQGDNFNDTFSIRPTYRDPFSGEQIKKISATSGTPVVKKIPVVITTNWPQINYGGIVKNQKSNKQLVLVQINGQSTMMQAGESYNNVELTKVYKDSIEVKFGKEKKFVRK